MIKKNQTNDILKFMYSKFYRLSQFSDFYSIFLLFTISIFLPHAVRKASKPDRILK